MTVLLWGEQLKQSWASKKNPKAPSCPVGFVNTAADLDQQKNWAVLLCNEADAGLVPNFFFENHLIAVLVSDAASTGWQKGTLRLPLRFWEQDCAATMQLATAFASQVRELRGYQASLHSIGETQNEIADSTAQLVQKLEQHIQIAAEIQKSLLPATLPKIAGVSLSARFFASQGLGGDYYDIFEFGDRKRFGFLIADSQTHGMAAALLSALLKLRIEQIREDFSSTGDFILELAKHIQNEIPTNSADLHLLYGILDRSSLDFRFASSGSLRPALFRAGRLATTETRAENPVRNHALPDQIPENHWALEPGDYVVLATKGLENLTSPHAPEAWIGELLKRHDQWPDLVDIQNEVAALTQDREKFRDDVTLVQFSVDPKALYLKRS